MNTPASWKKFTTSIKKMHQVEQQSPSQKELSRTIRNSTPGNWKKQKANSLEFLQYVKMRFRELHSVYYRSEVDEIEIKHTAFNRNGFALGAVVAAEWIKDKKGNFGMKDVLGL